MAAKLRKLREILAAGLRYSARTTALHESLPWDDDGLVSPSVGSGCDKADGQTTAGRKR